MKIESKHPAVIYLTIHAYTERKTCTSLPFLESVCTAEIGQKFHEVAIVLTERINLHLIHLIQAMSNKTLAVWVQGM